MAAAIEHAQVRRSFVPVRLRGLVPVARRAAPAIFYGLVFVVLFRKVFLPPALGGEPGMFFGWDVRREYWPDLAFRFHCLWRGEFPLWNPYELGGFPFAARSHAMAYYPPAWLVLPFALPHGELSIWGAQYFVAFHGVVGACGGHWLARRLGAIEPCCYLAGVTTLACGPVLTHVDSSVYYGINWIPWLVGSLAVFTEAPGRRSALRVAVFGILAGSSGTPPAVFYVLVACVLFAVPAALFAVLRRARGKGGVKRSLTHLGTILGWGALALVVALLYLAIIYVPNAALLDQAVRKFGERSYVLYRSLTKADLKTLVNSDWPVTWWFDLFIGIFPLLCALPALLLAPRAPALIALMVSLVAIDLGLGKDGHLLLPAVDHVPGFSLHRLPYRYASIFGALWPAVGARGLSVLVELARNRARPLSLVERVVAAALVALAAFTVFHFNPSVAPKAPLAVHRAKTLLPWELGLTALVITAPLAMPARWPLRRITLCGVALLAAMQCTHLWTSAKVRTGILQKYDPKPEIALADWAEGSRPLWRLWPYEYELEGAGSRRLLRYADGYPDPMELQRHHAFMLWAMRSPERLRLFGVRYVVSHRSDFWWNPSTRSQRNGTIQADAVPPLVWYGAVKRAASGYQALDLWEKHEPKGAAVVENVEWNPSLKGLEGDTGDRAPGAITHYGANRISGDISAPNRGLVVSNEVFADGWTVTVDGRPAKIVRADFLLRAVVVNAGRHRIVFEYRPPHYRVLLPMFFASLAGLLLWASWPEALALAKRIRDRALSPMTGTAREIHD